MFNLVCQMKSHFVISLFLAAGPLLSSCRDDGSAQDPMMMPEPEVTVTTVRGEEIPVTSNLPGRMEAFLQAEVRARVTGIIQERFYRKGRTSNRATCCSRLNRSRFRRRWTSARPPWTARRPY